MTPKPNPETRAPKAAGENETLRHLMRAAQAGDAPAYKQLLFVSERLLRAYVAAAAVSPTAIDDVVQDSLIALHDKRQTFDPSRRYLGWLFGIARHKIIDHFRVVSRELKREVRPTAESDWDLLAISSLYPLTNGSDPTTDQELSELRGRLLNSSRATLTEWLNVLSPVQRDSIRLTKIDGLSVAEAASQLRVSVPLIKVSVHRGLKKLKALFEKEQV